MFRFYKVGLSILLGLVFSSTLIALDKSAAIDIDQTVALKAFIHSFDQKQLDRLPKDKSSTSYLLVLSSLINNQLNEFAGYNYHWKCNLNSKDKELLGDGVIQYQLSCSGQWPDKSKLNKMLMTMFGKKPNIDNLKLNVVIGDTNSISIKPVIAKHSDNYDCSKAPYCQEQLLDMTKRYNKDNSQHKAYAVINGSYFYRYNNTGFFVDQNCIWKSFNEILFSVPGNDIKLNAQFIGDGLTVIDSTSYANNCASFAYNQINHNPIKIIPPSPQRATFIVSKNDTVKIKNLPTGEDITYPDIKQALGAGPMLMQNGTYKIDWQGIPGTFQYSANPGIAIVIDKNNSSFKKIVFFSVDGNNWKNGMFSFELTNLMNRLLSGDVTVKSDSSTTFDYKIDSMMALDRGGSTTMVTCKNGSYCQKISDAGEGLQGDGRLIFNGLAIISKG